VFESTQLLGKISVPSVSQAHLNYLVPAGPPNLANRPEYIAAFEIADISEQPEIQGIRITKHTLEVASKR
jgi:hypothetical protein